MRRVRLCFQLAGSVLGDVPLHTRGKLGETGDLAGSELALNSDVLGLVPRRDGDHPCADSLPRFPVFVYLHTSIIASF